MRDVYLTIESMLSKRTFPTRWQPAADIYRTRNGWLVKVELAGVRPDEIELSAASNMLLLRGRRRDWMVHECDECQSLEIVYDEFERRFQFPIDLTDATIESEYADGMLLVRIHGIRRA